MNKIICIFLLITAIVGIVVTYLTQREYDVLIVDKVVKIDKSGDSVSSDYLIFTEDIETQESRVFKNTDSIFYLKFNSSDFYTSIKVGHKYRIKCYWIRFPLLSLYPNIISFREI